VGGFDPPAFIQEVKMHSRFSLAMLTGLVVVAFFGATATAGEPAEQGPRYAEATQEETVEIRGLLASIPVPRHLQEDLGVQESGPSKAGGAKKGDVRETDPLEELTETEEERKELEEKLAKMSEGEKEKFLADLRKKKRRPLDDTTASEGVRPPGMSDEEFRRHYDSEKERVARERTTKEGRKTEIQDFFRRRAEAVAALKAFGEKAVPLVAEAFRTADLETGSVLVDIASASPRDPRTHEDILKWIEKRPFRSFIKNEGFFSRIGRMRIPGVIPVLEEALARASGRNRGALLRGLYAAKTPENASKIAGALQRFIDRGDRPNNEVALNFLVLLLGDRNLGEGGQLEIISKISKMAWEPAFKNLTPQIASALGRCGHKGAVEPLVELLDHRDGRVVLTAVKALGFHGPRAKAAADAVARFLDRNAPGALRTASAETLGKIRNVGAVWPLIDVLNEEETTLRFRLVVVRALKRITGKDLGNDGLRWTSWWEQEEKRRGREEGD